MPALIVVGAVIGGVVTSIVGLVAAFPVPLISGLASGVIAMLACARWYDVRRARRDGET
jgi:lysozyme family protein